MSRGNGSNHRIRAGHGIAARVELRICRPGFAPLGEIEAVPLIDRNAAFFRDERHIWDLADGGDDRIHIKGEFGALDGDRLLPAAAVEVPKLHSLADDPAHPALCSRQSSTGATRNSNLDAFLFGRHDLFDGRGHVPPFATVKEGHFSAETGCAAGCIDGRVASADDRHFRSEGLFALCPGAFLGVEITEELDAAVNALRVLRRGCPFSGSCGRRWPDRCSQNLYRFFRRGCLSRCVSGI